MAFRNLSAEIKGDATSYVAATSRAERSAASFGREAVQTAAALQILQGRADEAGDEIADVGRESRQATRSFFTLSGATTALTGSLAGLAGTSTGVNVGFVSMRVGMLGLTGVTLGLTAAITGLLSTLIPLSAIIGAMTLGLGALAGAFTTVIGTGILAFGRERGRQNRQRLQEIEKQIDLLETRRDSTLAFNPTLKERLETLKEERDTLEEQTGIWGGLSEVMGELQKQIQPIIVGFGEQFIPLIKDAVQALPQFVQNVVDAIGGTEKLADAVRAFGRGIFDIGPDLASFMFEVAQEAMPVMEDFLTWLTSNGGDIWSGMLETTRDLAPVFLELIDTFIKATPELNKFGSMILKGIVPAFSEFISIVEDLLTMAFESDGIQDFISKLAPDIKKGLQSVFKGLGDLSSTLAPLFAELFGSLVEWVKGPGRSIVNRGVDEFLDIITDRAGQRFSNVGDEVAPSIASGVIGIARAYVQAVSSPKFDQALKEAGEVFGSLIRETIQGAIDGALKALSGEEVTGPGILNTLNQFLLEPLVSFVSGFIDGLVGREGAFDGFVTALVSSIVIGFAQAAAAFATGVVKIQNIFVGFYNWLSRTITGVVENFVNTFIDGVNKVIAKFNAMLSRIPKGIRQELGIQKMSPLESVSLQRETPFKQLPVNEGALAGRMAQQIALTVGLEVEGDGPLAEFIDENVETKLKNEKTKSSNRGVRGMGSTSSSTGI